MSGHHKNQINEDKAIIHRYYMDIINCVPDAVYWIDVHCNLIGCNRNFITLLGLDINQDVKGTPYLQMKKSAHWSDKCIESLRLDDMKVIFSGEPLYGVEEKPIIDEKGNSLYFRSTRVPMYDHHKHIIGLIVVLTNNSVGTKKEHVLTDLNVSQKRSVSHSYLPHVLMIEDNIIAQNVERSLLTALNCKVDIAESGDKAIELFDPGKYDLVLMDIGLEETSGYVVAKQLRKMEKNTTYHVPIIALTGYAADVVKYDCNNYFMQGAITKPLTSEQADQMIKHYVYHMDVPVEGLKSL